MARLTEQLREWLARAEILAHGAERRRAEAVRALEAGRPWEARSQALAILQELPRSRLALALWADAAEAMMLDQEMAEALERLVEQVPFRADVWLRLAEARHRLGQDVGDALERAAEAASPAESADAARLWLADRDLAATDPARAERWLDQLSLAGRSTDRARVRRSEALLDQGEVERALSVGRELAEPDVLDGRGWLLQGRLLAHDDPDGAAAAFERALLLRAPGASRVVCEYVARTGSPTAVARLGEVAKNLGWAEQPEWRAAFAIAEGRTQDALDALRDGACHEAEPESFDRYVTLAIDARAPAALADAVALGCEQQRALPEDARALASALTASDPADQLCCLDAVSDSGSEWAQQLRCEAYRTWLPPRDCARWSELLDEFTVLARHFGALDLLREAESIAVDLERPLRVAVVGEFNAGKSSFINALIGEAVAPVGVLPTTATVNRLVWAPDRFVRIEQYPTAEGQDRVVPHAELSSILEQLDPATVSCVTIYAPLESLRRVEVVDTPGFNAPGQQQADRARAALEEAHVALWLFDITQPLTESERLVLREIDASELPLLVLLNKLDRLPAAAPDPNQVSAAVEQALQHVQVGLQQAGLKPEAPLIAFSARLALQGRHGDAEALEQSEWSRVEQMVEDVLVGRSELLRERVLRRRARGIAQKLSALATRQAADRNERAARASEHNEFLRRAVARVRSDRSGLESELREVLDERLVALERDLRPVSGVESDPAAARFIAARARAVVGAALAQGAERWLGRIAPVGGGVETGTDLSRELQSRVEAVAAALAPWLCVSDSRAHPGAAPSPPGGSELARDQLVALVVDELLHLADDAIYKVASTRPQPAELRARALAQALTPGRGDPHC